jgi:sugar/nucleoside kinase (ribokinase family)
LNWDPHWGRANADEIRARKDAVRSVLPWVDLAHGSVRELMEFSDAPELDSALKRLADWGVKSTVVHLGGKGAGYFDAGIRIIEPPAPTKSHVNMTGTGDVLSVCMMLLHHSSEIPIQKRLQFANSIVSEFIEGRLDLIPELAD